jgi:hypothetical protein
MAMRLINTNTLCLTWFMGNSIPEYAILSHTWENEEISFQEMTAISEDPKTHPSAKKSGYEKIVKTCQKALEDGIAYVWVDTCCIDKTSSSELSEAINTMYQWYQKAEVCYALLRDFDVSLADIETALPCCRWFTRGWCLQELIAPQNVEFFDVLWKPIGSKAKLSALISRITLIDEQVLIDSSRVASIPVARKMSWAAHRETTRDEDMAYCLLGILDVNMPMLYGEGPKAFMRLQEEFIKTSNDLSIFAFLHGSTSHRLDPSPTVDTSQSYCDLFATSPKDFMGCGNLVYAGTDVPWNNAFALTNKGLHFRRVRLQVDIQHSSYSMSLNCKPSESKMARIYLRKMGPGLFARYDDYRSAETVSDMDPNGYGDYTEVEEAYIITKVTPPVQLQLQGADEYAIHVWSHNHDLSKALQVLQRAVSSDRWDLSRISFLTKGERLFGGYWKVFPSLVRRVVEDESVHHPPSGHFYLACGLQHPEHSSNPQAWVRLYSLEEWRGLEKRLGIITNLNDVIGTLNANYTSDQMAMGANSTNPMTIIATIRLETEKGKSHFELELEFKEEPATETAPKITPATEATPVDGVPVEAEPETKDAKDAEPGLTKRNKYVHKHLSYAFFG